MLWSDPDENIKGWDENERGVSYVFGSDVVVEFNKRNKLDLICRAHQVVEDGYEFFAKRQLVTVFSAPNYCGEFLNKGAMMIVDESMVCSFKTMNWSAGQLNDNERASIEDKADEGSLYKYKNKKRGSTPPKIKNN